MVRRFYSEKDFGIDTEDSDMSMSVLMHQPDNHCIPAAHKDAWQGDYTMRNAFASILEKIQSMCKAQCDMGE
jgi:hypothetical protein